MTFPSYNPFANVQCQIIGESGKDLLRPVGEDVTGKVLLRLRVPAGYDGPVHRWVGGVGFIEVAEARAKELLASEVWRTLNPADAERLLPPEPQPEPAAEPSPPEFDAETLAFAAENDISPATARLRLRFKKKRDEVAAEVKKDPRRSDALIALVAGSRERMVCRIRSELVANGEIENIPRRERVTRPRPRRYRKHYEKDLKLSPRTLRRIRLREELDAREADLAAREQRLPQWARNRTT